MGSTARMEATRATSLARLAVAWDKRPDLSMGQLLAGALRRSFLAGELRLETLTDDELAASVESFVMFAEGDPDATPRP